MDLLQRASMDKSKASPTPMVTISRLFVHEGDPIEDESLFRSIVGALKYVVITRQGTLDYALQFTRSSKLLLEGYSDAS